VHPWQAGQARGHGGDDDGRTRLAIAAMTVGRTLEVFVGLFKFLAHSDRAVSRLTQARSVLHCIEQEQFDQPVQILSCAMDELAWAGTALGLVRGYTPDSCNKVVRVRSFDIAGYLSMPLDVSGALLGKLTFPPIYLNMQTGSCGPMTHVECSPRRPQSNVNPVNYQNIADPQHTSRLTRSLDGIARGNK
jgi:hypothetical protein